MSGPQPVAITFADRLTLDALGEGRWRSRHGDANQNGRSFGGQLLGQAMRAALMDAPSDRPPTMMQFLFLQGAMPDQPLDLTVTPLQDGKRFTSRHVRGTQGERTVLDAQVTCAHPLAGLGHALPSQAPVGEHPEALASFDEVPQALRDAIALMGGYGRDCNPAVVFRIPEVLRQLSGPTAGPRFRYWMRVPQPLPDDTHLHASAFAYLSDWWLNFCVLSPHLKDAGRRPMYISSLNHALWLHRAPRADAWLHVDATGVHAGQGRGLAVGQVHDLEGRHVASVTQECLVAYSD